MQYDLALNKAVKERELCREGGGGPGILAHGSLEWEAGPADLDGAS